MPSLRTSTPLLCALATPVPVKPSVATRASESRGWIFMGISLGVVVPLSSVEARERQISLRHRAAVPASTDREGSLFRPRCRDAPACVETGSPALFTASAPLELADVGDVRGKPRGDANDKQDRYQRGIRAHGADHRLADGVV